MGGRFPLLVAAVALVAAEPPMGPQLKDDELIQGAWEVTAVEVGGNLLKEVGGKPVGFTITFDGAQYSIKHKRGDTDAGTFKLHPDKKPKQIDVTPEGGDKPGLGIYELDGNTLKVLLDESPEQPRPEKFATDPKREQLMLITLKRVK